MDDQAPLDASPGPSRQQVREEMDRRLDAIPFPPMMVIHRGWFGDRVTYRPVEEIEAENRAMAARAQRR